MIKKITLLSSLAVLSTLLSAAESDLQVQIDALNAKIEKMEKVESYQNKQISKVNQQSANDNIKWTIDYRAAYDNLNYRYLDDAKKADGTDDTANAGKTFSNPSLLTSRLWLGMAASPFEGLTFRGQLAVYGYWGAENTNEADNGWRGSSRPHDWTVRFREGNFVYKFGNGWSVPMAVSAGRRPASMGFLANHRDGDAEPNSPLAHITNMEVDAAMVMFDFSKTLLPGSYLKVVYGRAHDPVEIGSTTPYIDPETVAADDAAVDFLVLPISIYNNGQSNLMAQYAMILNSKGTNIEDPLNPIKKAGAGTTHMGAVSYQLDGLNEDIDFLDASTLFVSVAGTMTDPDSGYEMLGSTRSETGYSVWAGFLFPDMMTGGGRFGLEYNWGSKYWTPMTWAEDTMIGSKIATRGSAYEGYWNIPIEGKNLSAQLRYTYIDYDYRANTTCYWDDPADKNLDSAQDIRVYVRYQY
jgi:hypothetical protein